MLINDADCESEDESRLQTLEMRQIKYSSCNCRNT